ncbi:MAG: nicotinate (nicotinamide) nucleotide adenylyltransferase [Deltaproteobacteria bacterium]|nr:nicotinate (nicotinamide) nucleotide adenylyltransferase [Deltaproteobacteria bacterium]
MERIAILGGTFNPVHYGHLRCAEEVRESLGFKKAFFMPVSLSPHKEDLELASAGDRLEMVRLATAANPAFGVSDAEVKRGGRSYTIDTVRELKKDGFSPTLIVGSDSFNDITTWCEYEELFNEADFAVVPRPGHGVKKMAEAVPVELAKRFWYDTEYAAYVNSGGRRVTYMETTHLDISSSAIRERIRKGLSIRYLLPQAVEEFISAKGLYTRNG